MSVDFNGKVGNITTLTGTTTTNAINNDSIKLGVMGFGYSNNSDLLSIDRHIPGLDSAIKHFSSVPDFEYNSKGENLVIAGDIMPDNLEERALCEY